MPLPKELPPIKDKIQQIFKFLEIADVSQWQGMNIFEAGDADSLYGILETAFEQAISQALDDKVREVREEINNLDIDPNFTVHMKNGFVKAKYEVFSLPSLKLKE